MEDVRKIYRCNPKRRVVLLLFWSIFSIVAFYAILNIVSNRLDLSQVSACIQIGYWIVFTICVTVAGMSVYAVKQKCLKVSPTEITYVYGVLSKQRITVPVSKILGCGRRKTITQSMFNTSDLFICTIGDIGEFYLNDIEQGQEAYTTILALIGK